MLSWWRYFCSPRTASLMFLFYDDVYINFRDSCMAVMMFVIETEDSSYSNIKFNYFLARTLKTEVDRAWENKQYLLRELTRGKIALRNKS